MNISLKELVLKVELLKMAFHLQLLRMLGVDEMVRKAFYEGWNMRGDNNFGRLVREVEPDHKRMYVFDNEQKLDHFIEHSRCWRHVDEAWFNSDAEESV